MFEINLETLFNNEGMEMPISMDLDLSNVDFYGEHPLSSHCKVAGKIRNSTGIVSMDANVQVDYSGICDRCACEVNKHFTIPMEHTFVTELNDESNDEFILIPSMRFDLEGLATEDVLLNLPVKVLCREDCKGICPYCGKNLNEGPCNCKKPIDPRLEGLLQLLDDDKNN